MLKKIIFTSVITFLPLLGYCSSSPYSSSSEIGRYQMVGVPVAGTGIQLYLLDTTNGLVWKSNLKNNWLQHDAWEMQIANSPEGN